MIYDLEGITLACCVKNRLLRDKSGSKEANWRIVCSRPGKKGWWPDEGGSSEGGTVLFTLFHNLFKFFFTIFLTE